MSASIPQTVFNYLVPASGNTHVVKFTGAATPSAPITFDYESYSLANNFAFVPQGVTVQNQSANDLTINVQPIGYQETIPANSQQSLQIPAIKNGSMSFNGNGPFTAYLTDYPLLPQSGAVVLTNTSLNVNLESSAITLPVAVAATPTSGSSYRNKPVAGITQQFNATLNSATQSVNFNGSTGSPYKLQLFVSKGTLNSGFRGPTIVNVNFTSNGIEYSFPITLESTFLLNDIYLLIDLTPGQFAPNGAGGNNAYTLALSNPITAGEVYGAIYEYS